MGTRSARQPCPSLQRGAEKDDLRGENLNEEVRDVEKSKIREKGISGSGC